MGEWDTYHKTCDTVLYETVRGIAKTVGGEQTEEWKREKREKIEAEARDESGLRLHESTWSP